VPADLCTVLKRVSAYRASHGPKRVLLRTERAEIRIAGNQFPAIFTGMLITGHLSTPTLTLYLPGRCPDKYTINNYSILVFEISGN